MNQRYNIIFEGKISPNFHKIDVQNNIQKLFNLNPNQLEQFFSGRITILKRDLEFSQAVTYKNEIRKHGLLVQIVQNNSKVSIQPPNEQMLDQNHKKTTHTLKKFCIASLCISLLLAVCATSYYFLITIPQNQQEELDYQYQLEILKIKINEVKIEEAKEKYNKCMSQAQINYSNFWARSCKSIAIDNERNLGPCLANVDKVFTDRNIIEMQKYNCRKQYGETDYNPDCTLPSNRADNINQSLKDEEAKCLMNYQMQL